MNTYLSGVALTTLIAYIAMGVFSVGLSLYGIILGFKASIIVGIIYLFAHPLPLITGAVQFFFDYNIPQEFINAIG